MKENREQRRKYKLNRTGTYSPIVAVLNGPSYRDNAILFNNGVKLNNKKEAKITGPTLKRTKTRFE